MHLLQKMGWKPGEGLGKEKNGALQPLLLEVKLDKRGLVANEEVSPTPRSNLSELALLFASDAASSAAETAAGQTEGDVPADGEAKFREQASGVPAR